MTNPRDSGPDDPGNPPPAGRHLSWPKQVYLAFTLLTRIPLPPLADLPAGAVARCAWAFPLVGALVGLLGGLVFFAANRGGLGISSSSLLALGSQVLLTGALHEDGLADTADGFGGGRDRDSRLAIMRDSRIGTYGVLALLLVAGLRFTALSELANSLISISDEYDETVNHTASVVITLIVSGALSRTAMTVVWFVLPPARSDGLSATAGTVPPFALALCLLFGLLPAGLLLDGPLLVAALVSVCIVSLLLLLLARRQIGGQTGDVLGATQQVAEAAALLAISAVTIAT
jgi:adenosylcobinamide-GDP ribazoletransferase